MAFPKPMTYPKLLALAGLSLGLALPALADTPPAEDPAVLATVQQLLDAWREADVAKAGAVLHSDFREVTLHETEGDWRFSPVTRERLLGAMGSIQPGDWDDRLIEPQVHVDGPIAVVWSRYRFRTPYTENGVFHDEAHCGIETFQLYRIDGAWKIVNFADTHMACDAPAAKD